jgi:hypothetical protein
MTTRTQTRLAYLAALLANTRILAARCRRDLETRPCPARPNPSAPT